MPAPTGSLGPAHRTCAFFPVALGVGLVMVLVGVVSASAQGAEEPASRVVEVEVLAPALEGNLLGTPSVQGAAIYQPPSYEIETEAKRLRYSADIKRVQGEEKDCLELITKAMGIVKTGK